jgi:hypothetical protein
MEIAKAGNAEELALAIESTLNPAVRLRHYGVGNALLHSVRLAPLSVRSTDTLVCVTLTVYCAW